MNIKNFIYRWLIALAVTILQFSVNGRAQIVNAESSRMQSDTVGWLGSFGAAFSMNKTQKNIFSAAAEAAMQYKTRNNRDIWLIVGNFNLLKANEERLLTDGQLHVRYNRKLNKWLRWEVFGQLQNNVITKVNARFLSGTGPRIKLTESHVFKLYVASLVMYENEKEKTTPVLIHNDLRSSSYLSFTWRPQQNLNLVSTTYYQPLFKNMSDYRILNQLVLKVKASAHFSLSVKWNYLWDSYPAGDAVSTVYSFATGFTYDM